MSRWARSFVIAAGDLAILTAATVFDGERSSNLHDIAGLDAI